MVAEEAANRTERARRVKMTETLQVRDLLERCISRVTSRV